MAMEDIDDLMGQGYNLAPRDIIRLNAFGCRVEHNTHSCKTFILQRCALLGNLVFREPTIGHNIFRSTVESVFEIDTNDNFFLDAYILTRQASELPDPRNKDEIQKCVNDFIKQLQDFTQWQVLNALEYVKWGNVSSDDELPIKKSNQKEDEEDNEDYSMFSIDYGYIKDGVAIGLNMSIDEMKKLTRSELRRALDEAWAYKCASSGYKPESRLKDKYESEYWAELDRIKNEHKGDLKNG